MIKHVIVEHADCRHVDVARAGEGSDGAARFVSAPPEPPLRVEVVAVRADSVYLSVDGEVDAATAHLLGAALVGHRGGPITFDCRAVSFMGVAGVDELLALATRFDVRVIPSRSVSRVVELCGVADVLSLPDSSWSDGGSGRPRRS